MLEEVLARPVKELVQRAIDVAIEVPEPFKVAVFSKVFDFLAGTSNRTEDSSGKSARGLGRGHSSKDERLKKPRLSTGPKGMASQLIEAGFFEEARTV
jgi:hypothetical protein